MSVVLRGRRSGYLWTLACLCVIGLSVPAFAMARGSPFASMLRANWLAVQAPEAVQVVKSYRAAERAALLTLDEAVLAQLSVFAAGEALDALLQRVRALRAADAYQKLEIESMAVVQVVEGDPYLYVMTKEVVAGATYPRAPGDAAAAVRETATVDVIYRLVQDEGRWKVAKVAVTEE